MSYIEQKRAQARGLVGKRIEIPVHYDLWMRGARYGRVDSVAADGSYVFVKMEHPQLKRVLRIWRLDYDYVKVLPR